MKKLRIYLDTSIVNFLFADSGVITALVAAGGRKMKTRIEERDEYVPTALRQVWEWKDSIYQETKHLSTRDALRYISERAAEAARQLKFQSQTSPT